MNPAGQYPAFFTTNPVTNKIATVVAVTNYAGSYGDNYASYGPGVLPWESPRPAMQGGPVPPLPPPVRSGSAGRDYQDLTQDGWNGTLRGIFDYISSQTVGLNSVTDGSSNTIMVGEMLPYPGR